MSTSTRTTQTGVKFDDVTIVVGDGRTTFDSFGNVDKNDFVKTAPLDFQNPSRVVAAVSGSLRPLQYVVSRTQVACWNLLPSTVDQVRVIMKNEFDSANANHCDAIVAGFRNQQEGPKLYRLSKEPNEVCQAVEGRYFQIGSGSGYLTPMDEATWVRLNNSPTNVKVYHMFNLVRHAAWMDWGTGGTIRAWIFDVNGGITGITFKPVFPTLASSEYVGTINP